MNKLYMAIGILLISTYARAGDFVFHAEGVITGKRSSCGKVCSERDDALRIDKATYNSITRFHKVVNQEVVEMTQEEIDIILQADIDATIVAEVARTTAFDDAVDNVVTEDTTLTKIDATIDAIDSYSNLKTYLKKKARYDLNN